MALSKILIVDDESNVRFVLEKILKNEGYHLDTASNGAQALQKLMDSKYDLMLLDLQMEGMDGVQVLESVRKFDKDIVIIILTAQGSMSSAIEGLRQGAFDYLFKPAIPEVIRERVREGLNHRKSILEQQTIVAQAANSQAPPHSSAADPVELLPVRNGRFIQSGKLFIDSYHREATFNEELLELTTTEFDILSCLVNSAPSAVSAQDLVKRAMGYEVRNDEARNTIKYHVFNLRQKIELDPSNPRHLKTVRYKGYLWVSD